MSFTPLPMDGLWGAVLAAESVVGCRAVLHGPGGCRSFLSSFSQDCLPREYPMKEDPFFFGSPRVPSTFLDENDYVYGANYKVTELLDIIDDAEIVVVIPTPGTSLICDDLTKTSETSAYRGKVLIQEDNFISRPMHEGYDSVISSIIRTSCHPQKRSKKCINILGVPIVMDGWAETIEELTTYAKAMDLEVLSTPGSGSSLDSIKGSTKSGINVTVLPEFCDRTSAAYSDLGIPTNTLPIPVGFDGTNDWIIGLAEATDVDPAPALSILEKDSERADLLLRGAANRGLDMRYSTYSIDFDCSAVMPLARWLNKYLGMYPEEIVKIPWWSNEYTDELTAFLDSIGYRHALVDELDPKRCDALFSYGHTAAILEKRGICYAGIDVWPLPLRMTRFIGRPFLGSRGAYRILDILFEKADKYTEHML